MDFLPALDPASVSFNLRQRVLSKCNSFGFSFTADCATMFREITVESGSQFFRLKENL